MTIKDNTVFCIFGMKGSGKSFLTKQIINEYPRAIIIDNQQEYDNAKVINGYRESIKALVEASKSRRFKLSLRATSLEEDLELINLASTIPNQLMVLEEASKYVSHAGMPREIQHLIRFGRHDCISQIYLARRASELHRDITANADIIISFHQHEPRDIAYLRDFMGKKAERARTLQRYEFIAYGKRSKAPLIVLERLERT